ncbi:MAG: TolC family protein [Bacteriovoracia bacterium]
MKLISIGMSLLFAGVSYADVPCKERIESYQDVIACAETRSPEIQSAQLELEKAKASVGAAGQWRNPEFSAERAQGHLGDEYRSETGLSLGIPIELGGKISARTAVAEGNVGASEARLFEARARVRAQTLLRLYRLRQAYHEQEIIDEAIGTFSKLVAQYSKRPNLSPEQQVSSSVYQLSKSEYILKRSETSDEIASLDAYFKLNLGFTAEQLKKYLPASPKAWPSLQSSKAMGLSPRQRVLQAEVDTANAELSLAKSEAWPTLTVGPSVKMQLEAGQSANLWGVNMSLPLPLFSLNGGAKATATAGVMLSEARLQVGVRDQALRREQLVRLYDDSVKVLGGSSSHEEIEKRHSDAERMFARGIIPSALVIEAHRTSLDLERSRHERELKTLEALLEIYTLEGTILETNL